MADLNWTAITVVVSLVLSGYVWMTQKWAQRESFIEVRLETLTIPGKDRPEKITRLVVVNHDPASAKQIDLCLTGPEGGDARARVH